MMYLRLVTLIAGVATTAAVAAAGTTIRPIEDFLSMQGTILGGGFLGWDTTSDAPLLGASVDYAGLTDAYPEGEEPEFEGTVIERTLKDGRAEVTVLLHSRGVNAWVVEIDLERLDDCGFRCQFTTNPTVFGYRPGEVPEGMEPALADTFLRVVFINSAPGDPLPNLLPLLICPGLPPFACVGVVQEVKFLHFSANAAGPLTAEFGVEEGTPGRCSIIQNGVFATSGKGATADGWPVGNIKLTVVGKLSKGRGRK